MYYCGGTDTDTQTRDTRVQTAKRCGDIRLNVTSKRSGTKEHVYIHMPEPVRIFYFATATQPQTIVTTNPTRIIFDNPVFYSEVNTCCDEAFIVPKCGDGLYTVTFAVSYEPGSSTATIAVELRAFSMSGTNTIIRAVLTPSQSSTERTVTIPLCEGSKVFLQATSSASGTITLNPATLSTNYFNIARVE